MAPKKKAGPKKGKKGPIDAPPQDLEAASLEELNQKIINLEKEKDKEEEYRNYMQLERDKINAFWEITKKELDDKRAELRNKDREMEEMEERHQVEVKVYKQKVKHLLYEHQNNLATQKAEVEAARTQQEDMFREREDKLDAGRRVLARELKETEWADQEHVLELRRDHAKEVTKLRQAFELQARELQNKYEKQMRAGRDELELRRKHDLHETEERKNAHIRELMRKHRAAFSEIKNYYSDITSNNLDLIKTLKGDVAEMKRKEALNEKLMFEISAENRRLSEPLTKALKEVESLRGQAAGHEKDRGALTAAKARLTNAEKQQKNLEWEREVLLQRLSATETERDELRARFADGVASAARRAGLRGLLLERRLAATGEQLEAREAQLGEVLAAANLEAPALKGVSAKLEEVLEAKNAVIRALKYDVAKVSKAHNDVIAVYEARLAEYGIPAEELGFRPLITSTTSGPAGLVVGA